MTDDERNQALYEIITGHFDRGAMAVACLDLTLQEYICALLRFVHQGVFEILSDDFSREELEELVIYSMQSARDHVYEKKTNGTQKTDG